MKDIGRTENGNRIVEMNKDEYLALTNLFSAVEGKVGLPAFEDLRPWMAGFDFSKTFDVIKAWYEAKMDTNRLQLLINEIQESLGK